MKYMLVGDTHGDLSFVSKMVKIARKLDIHTILQLGDFGVWDTDPSGIYFLDQLDDNCKLRQVRWVFLPGNHENWYRLDNYESTGLRTSEGFVPIRENIHYTCKTNVWTWGDRTFAAVGGAVSIDKAYRTPGYSWFEQEALTDKDLSTLALQVDGNKVDFLLSHDAPTSLPEYPGFFKNDMASNYHRETMDTVAEIVKPTMWFHGHYHQNLYYKHRLASGKPIQVYGLECNDSAMSYRLNFKNWAVLSDVLLEDGLFDVQVSPSIP